MNIKKIISEDRELRDQFYDQLIEEGGRLQEDMDLTIKKVGEHLPVVSTDFSIHWEDGEYYLYVLINMLPVEYDQNTADRLHKALKNGKRRSKVKILVGFNTHNKTAEA